MKFDRYAIYYTPQGSLAEAGAAWLGWDVARGQAVAHPEVAGLDVAA
ncbi:MAG: phosphonate metabolism protein, partial [Sulfitobacter sp.]